MVVVCTPMQETFISEYTEEARWPRGRASDSGARGRGSIFTQVAVLCP